MQACGIAEITGKVMFMINFGKLKTLGVLGGLGPQATDFFYNGVIEHTDASCDQEHIDMIILSHATTPDRTEAIMTGDDRALIDSLVSDVQMLERAGADNIAIPCNTSHYFYEQMQAAVNIPIIHMIRESVRYALEKYDGVKRIGIMGTDGTISAGIYDAECERAHVTAVHPGPERQKDVMHIIYDEIKAGERGSRHLFNGVIEELTKEKGCEVVILACTELSVYRHFHNVPDCCLDAMDVLIRESILRSGAVYQ